MLVPSVFESARSRYKGQTLAELLAGQEQLPLDVSLRYATEVATALRELHEEGRSHGAVDPAHVLIRRSTATLVPWERRGYPDPLADLSGFGVVLFAMLNGREPSGDELRLVPAKPAALKGPTDLRAAAVRLAERCLRAERDTAPDLQKVLTEIRLLSVMAKQLAAEQPGAHFSAAPPIALPPPQPLEVYAGAMPPIINPPHAQASASQPAEVEGKPAEHPPETARAKGSHSRPVLRDVMCPKCKGYHVRLSRPRTPFERFLSLLGMGVHRCHRCFYRYIPFFGRKIVRKSN